MTAPTGLFERNGLVWRVPQPPSGFFLCLDGPDGAGKSTQAARVVEALRADGHQVLAVRDPGGTALGDRLRSLLLDRNNVESGPRAEMLMFMASRAQLLAEKVFPALEAGQCVVTDRFLLSTLVYQGLAGGVGADEIWRVGHAATAGLLPNLTILLDVSREAARQRMDRTMDRIESRPESYQQAVRQGFRDALADFPAPHLRVDADQDFETVFAAILSEVRHALAKHSRP